MTLGYGTAALGRSLSRRERVRLVEAAYDAGIRWFDTAPLYGAGAAEEALGAALRGKDDVTVATKVGIVPPGLLGVALRRPAEGGRFADVRRQVDKSLRRLRREAVDVVLLHEVDAASAPAALDALAADDRVHLTGIATGAAQATSILESRVPDVVQLAAGSDVDPRGARLVLHSVLAGKTGPPSELLRAAASAHPGAVILVGSRNAEHIREAADALR
jgi:aryl-alcohol dehydrogenase-like predicted oxidoreductase